MVNPHPSAAAQQRVIIAEVVAKKPEASTFQIKSQTTIIGQAGKKRPRMHKSSSSLSSSIAGLREASISYREPRPHPR
jgi:hypothetical protein